MVPANDGTQLSCSGQGAHCYDFTSVPVSRHSALDRPIESQGNQAPIPLRLIAARGGVGIELYEAQSFGPVRLVELSWSLPGLSFPLDLSGGVREFRHRRGQVVRAVIELQQDAFRSWMRHRLGAALGGLEAEPCVWPLPGGFGVGVVGAEGAVAFDLLWAPAGERARFVISEPRTAGHLQGPAVAHALTLVDTALGKLGTRRGRVIDLGSVIVALTRNFLPALGVRVPDSRQLWFAAPVLEESSLRVTAEQNPQRMALEPEALRALELAELVGGADDALVAGDLDTARRDYMAALENAPRHPELCRTVASIDKDFEERCEAALGLLVEALPATAFGLVGAELLSQVGDDQGAEVAIRQAAQGERFAPLSALLWCRLAELSTETARRSAALDQALAVSPSSKPARWARFELRLSVGDLNGAVADAEHLEAAVSGSDAKYLAVVTAAQAAQARGYVHPARRLFERALRYLPKDAVATLGLARCFLADGSERRALALLRRAAELAESVEPTYSEVQLELAKLLARTGKDLPQAVSRVRRVSGTLSVEARALEGRWRARLGDISGASVAFGNLSAAIEMAAYPDEKHAPYLVEAAEFRRQQGDIRGAERQLSMALALSPQDAQILAQYRTVAAQLAEPQRSAAQLKDLKVEEAPFDVTAASEADHEQAASELSQLLLAGAPLTEDQFERLELALSALDREAELHALLWARYEDATPTTKAQLATRLSRVLRRLIDRATSDGNLGDVELYEAQLRML